MPRCLINVDCLLVWGGVPVYTEVPVVASWVFKLYNFNSIFSRHFFVSVYNVAWCTLAGSDAMTHLPRKLHNYLSWPYSSQVEHPLLEENFSQRNIWTYISKKKKNTCKLLAETILHNFDQCFSSLWRNMYTHMYPPGGSALFHVVLDGSTCVAV